MLSGVAANAQVTNDAAERFNRDLQQIRLDSNSLSNSEVPPTQRALVDYGGYLTASYLSLDDLNNRNHSLWQYDLVGYADVNIDNVQEFFVRGRLEWQEFGDGDAFVGRDHQYHATVERAYYRADLTRALSAYKDVSSDYELSVKGGRQFVYWANGAALSQTLDGVLVDAGYLHTHLQALGGITPAYTIDFDSSRPHFDSNTHRGFYGVLVSQDVERQKPFAYFVSQQDYNHDYSSITGTGTNPIDTHFKYNSNYLGLGSTGALGDRVSYGAEFIYESGRTLSNSFDAALAPIRQTKNEIRAFAGDVRVDYLLSDAVSDRTRISVEGIFSTGDTGRRHTTNTLGGSPANSIDHAYNGFGQLQNGVAFSPSVSNLVILRAGISGFPLKKVGFLHQLQTGLDVFWFQKFDDGAPLDEPSRNTGFVGIEPDIFVNWQIRSDVTLAMRYGVFLPGRAVMDSSARQFFYTGLTLAF